MTVNCTGSLLTCACPDCTYQREQFDAIDTGTHQDRRYPEGWQTMNTGGWQQPEPLSFWSLLKRLVRGK